MHHLTEYFFIILFETGLLFNTAYRSPNTIAQEAESALNGIVHKKGQTQKQLNALG